MLTRALGANLALELDEVAVQVSGGDVFMLCSDGLSNAVGEEDIRAALAGGLCDQAADALLAQALANGGRDNISVVVVRADDVDGDQTVMNPAL
jgi:protein phosphatase